MTDVFEKVETLIDDWYIGAGESYKYSLHEWLGLTYDQYYEYLDSGKLPTNWTPPEWTK